MSKHRRHRHSGIWTSATIALVAVVVLAGCQGAGANGPNGSAGSDGSSGSDDSGTVAADAYEPDNSSSSATLLAESAGGANPTWQVHTIHTSSDEDWIEIDVTDAGGNLLVNVAPVPAKDPADGVGNIDFVLEDASGTTVLTGNSTFGNSTESNVVINGSFSTGTHYIRVFAADSTTGTYQISWYRY